MKCFEIYIFDKNLSYLKLLTVNMKCFEMSVSNVSIVNHDY